MGRSPDELYQRAADTYGEALGRLVRAYELDPEKRRDLLQEIHLALWRSLERFEGRCSLRTWAYRVAHNVATSYVIRQRRANSHLLVGLEELDTPAAEGEPTRSADDRLDLERLLDLIHRLSPPDREIMLLYLEDIDAAGIGEIMQMSAVNVRSKIHRIKALLARRFRAGETA